MLAWVERAGLALTGAWFSATALRAGFIAIFAASTWLMWRITNRWYGPRSGFFAALALNLTGYYGLAASTFALPDGPLLFFWLLTIDRLCDALQPPQRTWPWVWVGLAWGGAMLSKYHAVFLPAGMLLLLLMHRPLRHWLTRPQPYLAVILGLVVFSPVLIWNAGHGWASFLFQGGRAMGGLLPRLDYLATAMLAQAGYLFPWIWIPLVVLMVREARNWSRLENEYERMALCLAIAPVLVFTAVACVRPVLPHWGLIGLVSLFPALGKSWCRQVDRRSRRTKRWLTLATAFPVVLLAMTIIEHRTGWLQRDHKGGWGIFEARFDPTAELYGWDQVADRLQELGILDDDNTFLFTRMWYQSAQIAHAIHLKRPVLCYNIDDARGFAFWSKAGQWVGHDGILLLINDEFVPVSFYGPWFQETNFLADFTVERGGRPVRRVQVIRMANQVAAFPFDFSPQREAARDLIRAGGHPMAHPQQTARRAASEGKLSR